ncbi:long-chain-fatty-acid--CoA ligase [Kallotenue papyrolyticum]|uniref:long-chain-fatty-acid--CoA ligase n=1 Tax=Kallotenue papyrolyticum TaxID=1325125 RepID=UPI000478528F|nr:long-chain fatty acid--CoA ligase [Kallotenue papyrolyticum]
MVNAAWFHHYEPNVPHTLTYPDIPLHQFLTDSARRYPDNIATRFALKYLFGGKLLIGGTLTYRQLEDNANRFAAALMELGVKPGDRVAVMLPNSPQFVIAFYGALKAGATVVNVNPTYTAHELETQLSDAGAETIILLNLLYRRFEQARPRTPIKRAIVTQIFDLLKPPARQLVQRAQRKEADWIEVQPGADVYRFEDLLRQHQPATTLPTVAPDDVALFQYTGGTTGTPKAAMLTHRNLVANTLQVVAWMPDAQPGKETIMAAIPFFHVYGMTVAMNYGIYLGAELVIVPNPRQLDHVMQAIQQQRATIFPGVPAMYIGIVNHPRIKEFDLRSIKACISGSAPLPVEIQQRFEALTGGRLVEGYGLTEAAPVTHCNPIHGERRAGSIGLPLPDIEAMIVDPETGLPVPWGEPREGELLVRGPNVMKGYWNRPEETAKTIDAEGWLHTGDIARMDEDGYFYIVDRAKDMINASGFKVLPREVEEVLFEHPKVLEAAVAGVPDPKRGETVKAFIVLKPGESCTPEEIEAFCRERLAPYKVPRLIEFRQELPKTQVGKVLRRVLVDEHLARQASEAPAREAA